MTAAGCRNLKKVVPDDKGYVTLLEMEGDIVVPRKTVRSMVIPGAIVTVAIGGKECGPGTNGVIRFRFRKNPFSSYLLFPYHYESADDIHTRPAPDEGPPGADACDRRRKSAARQRDAQDDAAGWL
jgi:hypothetical protein